MRYRYLSLRPVDTVIYDFISLQELISCKVNSWCVLLESTVTLVSDAIDGIKQTLCIAREYGSRFVVCYPAQLL